MDRLIYTAMAGAKMLTQRHETVAHNLANVNTNGFRAELTAFRAAPVYGPGSATRVAGVETTTGANFQQGPLTQTGNPMDVAVNGRGFFVVQTADGSEAYTRDGALTMSAEGGLTTRSGQPVLGEGGPIVIPANHDLAFGRDGSIGAIPRGQGPGATLPIGRFKLVNPDEADLARGADGLFRMKDGSDAPDDPTVVVAPNSLEGSNVNAVESLVSLIAISRQFETQMKLLSNADQNARQANQILSMSS